MSYRLEFAPRVHRQLHRLPRDIQVRLAAAMEALAANPRPHGVKKLSGEENLYRIRAGDYRIIYQIRDKELIVLIVKVAHRREVYRV